MLNLVGKTYGRLTVIRQSEGRSENGSVLWECRCSCGNNKIVAAGSLNQGYVQSCGCLYKETRFMLKRVKPQTVASFNAVYRDYKNRAKKLEIAFTLTEEDFKLITSQACVYCGVGPKQFRKHGKKNFNGDYLHNGLDRIDNNKGYTIDNVAPCCVICNKAKRDLSLKDFEEWIQRLVTFQTKK